jgi:hypothetical protein
MSEFREPSWAEICSSIEYQQYSLLFSDEIAFQMAEGDLIEERKLQVERAAAMRAYELRTMPYSEYLQTNGTYERRGHEEPSDVIALCPTCHSLFHEWRDLARQQ